jgi:hypothetical protein
LPFAIETPGATHASMTNHGPWTGNEKAMSRYVDGLVELEPSIQEIITPWTKGQEGHTEHRAGRDVLSLLQSDMKLYLEYGTTTADFVPRNQGESVKATSRWRVQDGLGKPSVTVLALQGRGGRRW